MELEPAMVINATGAWVDQTLQQLDVPAPRLMGGTKGSHIFTRHAGLRAALGQRAIYAEATDGRPVFLLPLGPFAMVGTTDLPVQGDPQQAATEPEEVQYLLGTIRQVFPQLQLTHRDVQLHCCGVRPLPSSQSSDPGSVTRRHLLKQHEADGLAVLSLIGGKLTTCRQVAEEVATIVCQHLDRPCKQNSRNRLIPGAEGYADGPDAVRRAQEQLSSHGGWTADQVQAAWQLGGSLAAHLLGRHPGPPGTASQANIAGTELAEPLVRHVIRHEWCTHLSDVVCRRLLLPYRTGIAAATLRQVARLMQQEGRLPAEQIHWQQQACRQELRERHGIEVEV
jgi:glycerol-3-phosphate dehydrogenase